MVKTTKEEFIRRSREYFGDKYDYSKAVYVNVNTKVEIVCPMHGSFMMRPAAHYYDKRGCPQCDTSGKSGFSSNSKWVKKPKRIYLLEIVHQNEKFLKFGLTTNSVKSRFQKGQFPYPYKILFEAFLPDGKLAHNVEEKLKSKYPKIQYSPAMYFKGHTECIDHGAKDHLLGDLERLLNEGALKPV